MFVAPDGSVSSKIGDMKLIGWFSAKNLLAFGNVHEIC
jgi:hypothetical protein